MFNLSQKICFTARLYPFIALLFSFILSFNANAEVYQYSLNKLDGLVAFQYESNGGKTSIKTFCKSPQASELQNLTYLQEIFVSGTNDFKKEKELVFDESRTQKKLLTATYGDRRWGISYDDNYARIHYFEKGEIKDRLLLSPKLPVHDFSELFFLPLKVRSIPKYDFYLLEKAEPISMSLIKESTGKFLLKRNVSSIAFLYLGSQGAIRKIDFSPCSDHVLKKYSFELRSVKRNISDIGLTHVALGPSNFKELLENSDQWMKQHERFFEKRDGSLRYNTGWRETYNVTHYIYEALRNKLLNAKVLVSNSAMKHIRITPDENANGFLPVIYDKCRLRYTEVQPEIVSKKQVLEEKRANVRFNQPLRWNIKNDHLLVASIGFDYTRFPRNSRRYYIESQLRREFRSQYNQNPDYYEVFNDSEAIRFVGKRRIPFWFDRVIGTVSLEKAQFWRRLSEESSIREKISCNFESSQLSVILHYTYREDVSDVETVSFNLVNEFETKYSIRPDDFVKTEDSRAITIRGRIANSNNKRLTSNDVKEIVSTNDDYSCPSHCTKEVWNVFEREGKYHVKINCDLNMPLEKNLIQEVVSKQYDIMEWMDFQLIGFDEIRCSFWGFEKS